MTEGTVAAMIAHGTERLRGAAGAAARLEAEVLLAHEAGVSREWLMARPEVTPASRVVCRYARTIERRRTTRIPVAYLTGGKEFAGLPFAMRSGVFIPRPETEGLLELVETWLRPRLPLVPGEVVVDACTGSGVLAVALARRLGVRVFATDRSRSAVALTRHNARRLGVAHLVRAVRGDGIAPLSPSFQAAAVVANPPYVRDALWTRLPRTIRDHEPRGALLAGPDGLRVVRKLLGQARVRMAAGGLVAIEIAPGQRRAVVAMLSRSPWTDGRVEADLTGRIRYAVAVNKGRFQAPGGDFGPPLRGRASVDRVQA